MATVSADEEQALNKRWVQQWKITGQALERARVEELRRLTEEKALEIARRLSSYPASEVWIDPERRESRGLIEQQRLFARAVCRTQ